MASSRSRSGAGDATQQATEAAIRIGVLAAIVLACLTIVAPFVIPVLWGAIIATALYPAYRALSGYLGERDRVAASLVTAAGLLLVLMPAILLGDTLLGSVSALSRNLADGSVSIPPPPKPVAAWPVLGGSLHYYWAMASENLQEALGHFQPQLVALSSGLVSFAAGTLRSVLEFVVAVLIAGVLLARSEQSAAAARAISARLAGDRGLELTDLAGATVRSVAQGVLGVALIQALLAGVGFVAIGVPGAGLWALLVLFVAVLQLPPLILIAPIIVWAFYTASTPAAVIFAVWGVVVSLSDNLLKPLLLGRGLPVPMLIVLVGAIGGMLAAGIVGLFVGSVVLALGYQLLLAWLETEPA